MKTWCRAPRILTESKYAAELDLGAASEMLGLDCTIFRPHNVYGERKNIADKYRNVWAYL